MIIRNHRDVYKKVADKLDIDYETIKLIGDFTWGDLHSRIEEFQNREIYVYGLGSFKFRKKKTDEYIARAPKLRETLSRFKKSEEVIQAAEQRMKERLEKIKPLMDEWNKLIEEKEKFKSVRQEYDNRNLQEQKGDLGGTKEQSI